MTRRVPNSFLQCRSELHRRAPKKGGANASASGPSPGATMRAAINAAFRFRQQWAEAYFAHVSLEAKLDRFDLIGDLTEDALWQFQDRMTSIIMSEARSWRDENIKQTAERPRR